MRFTREPRVSTYIFRGLSEQDKDRLRQLGVTFKQHRLFETPPPSMELIVLPKGWTTGNIFSYEGAVCAIDRAGIIRFTYRKTGPDSLQLYLS